MQYNDNVKLSTEIEKNIQAGFNRSGEPKIENILNGYPAWTNHPTSLVFSSFLVEFHRDRGIE